MKTFNSSSKKDALMKILSKTLFFYLMFLLIPSPGFSHNMIVIRHGEALNNVKSVFSGKLDESVKYPLTENGKEQVLKTAKVLKHTHHFNNSNIEAVYVSPFLRTEETADILVKEMGIDKKKVIPENLLVECDNGTFEGKLTKDFPYGKFWDHSRAHEYSGETDEDVLKRTKAFLEKIREKHYNENIIIVTHGTPASQLYTLLSDGALSSHFENAEFRILPAHLK
jgi:broad specificity phosphatase PhoE